MTSSRHKNPKNDHLEESHMITTHKILAKKNTDEKVVMVTCYDYWSSKILKDTDIDCILVGDSSAIVMQGEFTTINATTDIIAFHTRAVAKGCNNKFIVADMPFLSYRSGMESAMKTVQTLMQSGAHAVKLEGADGNLELIQYIVESGVPVMGHLGLTPQMLHQLGGYKVQGRTQAQQEKLLEQAKALEKAGCFAIVLECISSEIATTITKEVSIPTIGIGAGANTDGQVLVLQDLLGCFQDFKPKFVKQYMNGVELIQKAVNQFATEVNHHDFPGKEHEYE